MRADCSSCFALCCVALAFTASVDFAINKAVGEPCRHLQDGNRCGIHHQLRDKGFRGCSWYDCFGAGQQVSQVTFGGQDWRADTRRAQQMFAVLPIMRQLHELLWYLTAAMSLVPAGTLYGELAESLQATEQLTRGSPDDLVSCDVDAYRPGVGALLRRTSEQVRTGTPGADLVRADLAGADLRGSDLRGADLRGALLIAVDLRGVDLRLADLIGADLRDARLQRADLSSAIFLTQPQIEAARGDARTRLPASLIRPEHWSDTGPSNV